MYKSLHIQWQLLYFQMATREYEQIFCFQLECKFVCVFFLLLCPPFNFSKSQITLSFHSTLFVSFIFCHATTTHDFFSLFPSPLRKRKTLVHISTPLKYIYFVFIIRFCSFIYFHRMTRSASVKEFVRFI